MVVVEGKGDVAPSPVKIVMDTATSRILASAAKERAARHGYSRGNAWKRGLAGSRVVPPGISLSPDQLPIYCGMMGEHAYHVFLSRRTGKRLSLDLSKRRYGDDGIDSTYGRACQVKTRMSHKGTNLVRVVRANGMREQFRAEAFVFCEWSGVSTVSLLGWIKTACVKGLPDVPARRGNHRNIEIPDTLLLPMARLAQEILLAEGQP